jgi:NADPH:quinone reductase-like Zn-dependent oxidoreductase
MFAVYAKEANSTNPIASVVVGERPEPVVPEGWVRVRVTHASLNRHDIANGCYRAEGADPLSDDPGQ